MSTPRIFGRDPAVWVGLIEAILLVALSFGLGLNAATFAAIMALVSAASGLLTAWLTRDTLLAAALGVAKALFALFAVYGLVLTDAQTGALLGALAFGLGMYQRTQTSPAYQGEHRREGVAA